MNKIMENPLEYTLDEVMKEFAGGRCDMETLISYLEVNEKSALEYFNILYIVDLKGILRAIDNQKEIWKDVQKDGRVHSGPYFDSLLNMLQKFRDEVENAYLFDVLPDWWAYSINVDTYGITLRLNYYAHEGDRVQLLFDDEIEPDIEPDQTFELIKVKSRMLRVEEYASMFSVDPPAVRQWIRRGKLPTAVKYGREWRIPELCDVGGRTYTQRRYSWDTELLELPEEYTFLKEYTGVILRRDFKDKKKYVAAFIGGKEKMFEEKTLSIKDRERLELVLISNPLVSVDSGMEIYFISKIIPPYNAKRGRQSAVPSPQTCLI